MEKVSNLKIFETSLYDRPMELKSYFIDYNEDFDYKDYRAKSEEIKRIKEEFLENRILRGKKYGFDGKKIIVPNDAGNHELGSYFVADDKIYSEKDDLIYVKKSKDIVLLKSENPGIVIGYPVADDPVVIIEDKKNLVSALAHCNLDKISKKIPLYMIKALENEAGSNVEDLKVYISSNLKKQHNRFIIRPKTIKENPGVWKDSIQKYKVNNIKKISTIMKEFLSYQVDQEKAISNMLVKKGIKPENITISDNDTYQSGTLYSDRKVKDYKNIDLQGKFLVGAYYEGTFPEYKAEKGRIRSL